MDVGLLERDIELVHIGSLLDAARAGDGSLLVIEGPAGIGKTALLRAARRAAAERGMTVLGARAGELETPLVLGVVRQLLEPVVTGPDGGAELLGGAARLAEPLLRHGDLLPGRAEDTLSAVYHSLYWLVVNVSQRSPVLLAVDDAHWADTASLRLFDYIVRRLDGLPVLVALTVRPDEGDEASTLLAALAGAAAALPLRPRPLSLASTAALVRARLEAGVDDAVAEACWQATGGNPFLLGALCDELVEARYSGRMLDAAHIADVGPDRVARAVSVRLSRMPPAARSVARAIAVLGQRAEYDLVARLAGVDRSEEASVVAGLTRAGIVVDTRPLRFVHPIVGAAVYEELTRSEQAQAHASAARLLHYAGAELREVATHLLLTDPSGQAWMLAVLRRAAADALRRGAPDGAIRYLTRALDERPAPDERAELLVALGEAGALVRAPEAAEHLEDAIRATADPGVHVRAARLLARLYLFGGRMLDALRVLDGAMAVSDDPEQALLLEAEFIGVARFNLLSVEEAGRRARCLRDRHPALWDLRSHAARLALATVWNVEATVRGEPAADCAAIVESALEGQEPPTELSAHSHPFLLAVAGLIFAERYDRAGHLLDDALRNACDSGSAAAFLLALIYRSRLSFLRGDLEAAEADARTVEETIGDVDPFTGQLHVSALVDILVETGRLAEARRVLERHDRSLSAAVEQSHTRVYVLWSRGRLRMAEGRPALALDDFLHAGHLQAAYAIRSPAVLAWQSEAALAHAALGEDAQARTAAADELELARAVRAPRTVGVALRALGLVTRADVGLDILTEAVTTLEASDARLEHARALTDLGAALRRAQRRDEARRRLTQALDLAEDCGATVVAERAHRELVVTGARPRRRRSTGPLSLTPSERRAAEMAGTGMTNSQIAQSLFVTLRTVEMHLSSAYRKLGISSRAELSDILGDGGNTMPTAAGWGPKAAF